MRSSERQRKPNSKRPRKPQVDTSALGAVKSGTQQDTNQPVLTLGQKIRTARLSRGLTQVQLGTDLVTPSMISQIEADRAKPSSSLLAQLANRLGLPVEYFLNDLDEQFTFQTYLRQAEYELLLFRPEAALTVLEQAKSSNLQGAVRQYHNLLTAKAYRLRGSVLEAVYILEEVREHAYFTHDLMLQLRVEQESGYLESAMDNGLGAIHDWENALKIGESLINESPQNVPLLRDMFEVSLRLSQTLSNLGRSAEARQVLGKAFARGKRLGSLREIAETFRAHSQVLIDQGNTSEAKEMMDRAITVIQTAKVAQEFIWAEITEDDLNHIEQQPQPLIKRAVSEEPTHSYGPNGPWVKAALSLISVDPIPFLEAELVRIRQALESRDIQAADRRITRCLEILEDYCREDSELEQVTQNQRMELVMMNAKLAYEQGQLERAIERAEAAAKGTRNSSRLILVLAQLIDWYGKAGKDEKVLELSERLQNLLEQTPGWPSLL